MGKNYIRLELGGKERGLKFNMGCLKRINELTGGDPFTFFGITGDINEQLKQLSVIVYAGLLSNSKSKNEEPDFKEGDVMNWVEEMDMSEAKELMLFFSASYRDETASQEGSENTQAQAANMA